MKTRAWVSVLVLGLGMSLAVVWALGGGVADSVAAPVRDEARAPAERPLSDATPLHYVVVTGTDSGDCSTPGSACRTVQYAVDQAGEGDEIRVAAGTYTDISVRSGVTQAVYISKTVTVRGGYTITDWTTSAPQVNPTMLNPQGQGRVVYITGNITPTLEGLHMTGGDGGADPGGGLYIREATAILTNNLVFNNTTTHHGGGLYLDGSSALLSNNTVFSNTGDWGGGVTLWNSPAILRNNTIRENIASGDAGGGLLLRESNALLQDNTILSNTAGLSGGGMYIEYSDPVIRENKIAGSTTSNALFLWHSDTLLDANIITHNDTGVFMHASEATLTNNVIADNQYSGLSVDGASPCLLHNTIVRNNNGIYITDRWQDGTYYTSTVALTNTILANHTWGLGIGEGNTVIANGILWHDTPTPIWQSPTATVTIQNQHWGDPAFADDGYHLTGASAAIDTGVVSTVNTDVDVQSRPAGRGYELGADEFHGPGLYVTKHANANFVQTGEYLTYTLQLTNTGTVDLHPIITDTLPGRVSPTGLLTWVPGVMAPGDAWAETVVVTVEPGDARTLVNVVEATSPEGATGVYTETTSVPGTLWVTSPADSGSGTLRQALESAVPGDTVAFDPTVFPPASPVTIVLTNGLPTLDDGHVTIDGSDAGVILDGSGIGTTPETLLLDDVSLTVDGGANLIENGDFSAGLGHWRPIYEQPGATRSITTAGYVSSPNAYAWSTVAHTGQGRTVYDTADTSDPYTEWPYYDTSSVWITVTGGTTAEWRFWYKDDSVYATLRARYADGHSSSWGHWFGAQAAWTEAVVTQALDSDVVAVAVDLEHRHSKRWVPGLRIESNQNAVRGLQILNFPDNGINLSDGAQYNTIGGDRTLGAGPMGQGNLLSSNGGSGLRITDSGTMHNTVSGNYVGIDANGTAPLGNGAWGILVSGQASHNLIGGDSPGERNIISGNRWEGVLIVDSGTMGNTVSGNYIGTDAAGTTALGNGYPGVAIQRATYTVIGGDQPGEGNLISGNAGHGVSLQYAGTMSNTVSGNYIGTDASGLHALPNGHQGVKLSDGASYNTIGGDTESARNLISGNDSFGVYLEDSHTTNNVVSGNYIGTDAAGTTAIGNAWYGIAILGAAHDNTIGGDTDAEGNLISGNDGDGILLWDVSGIRVSGNTIGTDADGLMNLGNTGHGIRLGYQASQNVIGGSNGAEGACSGDCNLISGNGQYGIYLHRTGTATNTVSGNYVGANVNNTAVISNVAGGIFVGEGARDNLIGGGSRWSEGVCTGVCNLIRGNGGAGVEIADGASLHNTVTLNSIYANAGLGIDLRHGGNTELPAPVIYPNFDLEAGTASGSACANCTVDLFSDAHGEGRHYEGRTTTGENGEWQFAKGSAFAGPELTALATDAAGNTSEFGQDWPPDPPPSPVFAAPICGVTNQAQPTFAGTAQMGSTVKVGTGGQLLGETTTDDLNRWRVTPGAALTDATHLITSTATTVWGTSGASGLSITVDAGLAYNPVGVTFVQRGTAQHPHDATGCVDPAHNLGVVLWPSEPVTVRVPVRVPTATVYAEVNSIRYDLADADADGVFTGQFTTPESGDLVIVLVVDAGAGQHVMQIGSTIDPDGYVYDGTLAEYEGITQTLAGVTVTLQVSDTVRQRWVKWDAPLYDQVNAQITQNEGYFSFFTPPGTYRLVAEKAGYQTFTSPNLVVVDEPIRYNIPLRRSPVIYALEKHATPDGEVAYGDEITYTLHISAGLGTEVGVHDPLTDTTFLRFLARPAGVVHADDAITGTFTMTSTDVVTVSFVARVDVPMTPGALTTLTNRACAYPAQISPRACTWAEVSNPATYPYDMVIFKAASRIGQVKYGEEMTYTLSLTGAIGTEVALYDPLQGTEFLRFVEQPGTITHDDGVVTGTVEIGSGDCVTVRFAVRVTVPATGGTTVDVVNSVQACPVGGTADDCVWSNEVVHTSTRSYRMYLPLIVREDQD